MSNTKTIVKNAGWFGIESTISTIVSLFTSIAIARYLGPSENGEIIYVSFIAGLVAGLGSVGIPATTRKYMAEFIGMGDRSSARFIFLRTLVLQAGLACLTTGGLLVWVLRDANQEYKWAAVLIVLSIWPSMVNNIPAMANAASEELSRNMPASVVSTLSYFLAIGATVVFHWGVTGVGASLLIMQTVNFLVRFFPTLIHVLAWETSQIHPPGLFNRMATFAWQSVTSMVLAQVVWGRSEVILLKFLHSDIRQVAYYSIAFSLADKLLLGATIFGLASATTVYAQYGRDKSRLPAITASSFRYLALTSIPLHFIAAALAVPAMMLLYGKQYQDAAMVVALAPLMCIFKAFIAPAQSLLQSSERQGSVITATIVAGIVDMGVAWYFIPSLGAVGACIGNGTAQAVAAIMMWAVAIHLFKVKLPWIQVAKITLTSALASLTAYFIATRLAPLWGVLIGGSASLVVLFALFYIMRVLEPEDHDRFMTLAGMMPKPVAGPMKTILSRLIRPALADAKEKKVALPQ